MKSPYTLLVVRIFVRDFERAIEFYTQTLGIPLAFESRELGWAQLDTGAAQLALERMRPDEEEERDAKLAGRFVGVSLAVADIDAAYAHLVARGVEFLAPPERMSWGGVLAHLRDPEGNVLTLVGAPREPASG